MMRKNFSMRRLIVSVAALAALMPATAGADTLTEAMISAVDSNPTLAAQRQRLNATREALPQAWSEALPQISISGGAGRSDAEINGVEGPNDEDWSASANASQLLFGSGRVAASTRGARAQIRGAVADYDGALQTLLLDVTRAYADVRQAQQVVAAGETTVSNLTRLLEYSQAQFDAGVVTRTDVAQAQARLAQARTQLVRAQALMAAAVQAYLRLVGRPPSDLQPPPMADHLPPDLANALDVAGRDSPLLRSAVADADAADAGVDSAAAQGRPRITLEAGQSIGADFDDDTTESINDTVGVRVSVPIFQGGLIRSRTRQQRALRAASSLDLAATQRLVQEQVTNSWTALAASRAAVDSARDQLAAAELAYEGVTLEQETGLRATFEVLEQEQVLLDARLALAQAERDLVVAERALLASMGQLYPPETSGSEAPGDDDLRGR
jgi:outer membrane protein